MQTFHRMELKDPVKLVGKALPGYLLAMTEVGGEKVGCLFFPYPQNGGGCGRGGIFF